GAVSERLSTHRDEHFVGRAQLLARVYPPALASQPLAVEQMGARELHAHAGPAEVRDRLAVEALGDLALAHKRMRTRFDPKRPIGAADTGHLEESSMGTGRFLACATPGGCLNQLDHAPVRRAQ